MKRLPVYYYCIVLILGAVITRECISGFLKPAEQTWASWLQGSALPDPQPRVTLVTAENADGLLSPLDVALFLRAARQFGAGVAAVAAFEIDHGEEELLRSVATRAGGPEIVAGALLSGEDDQSDPIRFLTVPWPSPEKLPGYSGVWNNFPAVEPVEFGFLNLPDNLADGTLPVLARWKNETVASFSLACFLQYLSLYGVQLQPIQPDSPLRFTNQCRIPISPDAAIALESHLYPAIERLTLGDLLVAAEKGERTPHQVDPRVIQGIEDRIVVLAPAPTEAEIQSATFTLGQFQALGIASLAAQFQLPAFGRWIWWVPFLWFFPWIKWIERLRQTALPFGLLILAIYAYAAFTLATAIGLLLPGIPALAWGIALLAAPAFKRTTAAA